jgi:hypothetical protein
MDDEKRKMEKKAGEELGELQEGSVKTGGF